jgi:hypothetical protein
MMNPERFGNLNPDDDDFVSIEAFVESLLGEDEIQFDWRHLQCLNFRLGLRVQLIRQELESYGLTLADRSKDRHIRTFGSNPHDRWHGPGSCPTHGGSGWAQIVRRAGQEG